MPTQKSEFPTATVSQLLFSQCPSEICAKSTFLYHCYGNSITWVQNWCPWELLHVDNLAILAESLGEFKMRLINWKEGLQVKGLKELWEDKGHVL